MDKRLEMEKLGKRGKFEERKRRRRRKKNPLLELSLRELKILQKNTNF